MTCNRKCVYAALFHIYLNMTASLRPIANQQTVLGNKLSYFFNIGRGSRDVGGKRYNNGARIFGYKLFQRADVYPALAVQRNVFYFYAFAFKML